MSGDGLPRAGCLRNGYFREQVHERGPRCLVCERQFNRANAKVRSVINQHHADYLRLCIGSVLAETSADICREAADGEHPEVPDCRSCHQQNPSYFEGCITRIFPVHRRCHERIHERERWIHQRARKALRYVFTIAAMGAAIRSCQSAFESALKSQFTT